MILIKKADFIVLGIVFLIGIISLITFRLIENLNSTGNVVARITYRNELILTIDLESLGYTVYETEYKDQIDTGLAEQGIFYVPGLVTSDMLALYQVDQYAFDNQIVGIKIQVVDSKISVVYQESPKDLCELQPPTDSHLRPIVCLPNELVIDVYTNLEDDEFIPDSILE